MKTTINSKGEVILPPKILKQLRIKDGTYFQIAVDDSAKQIILTPVKKPITREYLKKLQGSLKGNGSLKTLMKEKEFEKRY